MFSLFVIILYMIWYVFVELHIDFFLERRLKSHVLSQLPSKSREAIVLDPNSVKVNKVMKASHQLVDKMKVSEYITKAIMTTVSLTL